MKKTKLGLMLLSSMTLLFGTVGVVAAGSLCKEEPVVARAEDAVFDFSEQGYANGATVGTVSIDKNVSVKFSNAKYYTSGTAVRAYAGSNFTISCTSGTITSITITFGSSDSSNAISANVGTFTSPVWSGSSNSVKFTIAGSSGNRRIQGISVSYSSTASSGDDTVAVTGVTLDKTTASVKVNSTVKLTPTIAPSNATNTGVTWSSSDESVATVIAGIVTGVKAGTATITVTTTDGSKQATCAITVLPLTDTYNLNGTTQYLHNGSYYLSTNGTTSAPFAVLSSNTDHAPTALCFYQVGDDQFKIGDATSGSYLYITNTNNGLRYGAGSGTYSNIWTVSGPKSNLTGDYSLTATVSGKTRAMSLYDNSDFRCYETTSTYATNMSLSTNVEQSNYSVEIDQTGPITLSEGETADLTATFSGGDIVWSIESGSDKISILTNQDNSCTVTGSLVGTAVVKASVGDRESTIEIVVESSASPVSLEGDVIDGEFAGTTGTGYLEWSGKTGKSGTEYAGNTSGGSQTGEKIQINNKDGKTYGIVSTSTVGFARKVQILWDTTNSSNTSSKKVDIYGKHNAYSGTADLYDSTKKGELIGSIAYGTSEFVIPEGVDYEYIGFLSNGAVVLNGIGVTWEKNAFVAAKESISATSTKYSLKYNWALDGENYTFTNIEMRYGGLVDIDSWGAVKDKVTEYGVVACLTSSIESGYGSLSEVIDEILSTDESATIADVPTLSSAKVVSVVGNQPDVIVQNGRDYVLFNGVVKVPSLNYIDSSISAVAYVKIDGQYVLLGESVKNVRTIAGEYLENSDLAALYGGSLSALAHYGE